MSRLLALFAHREQAQLRRKRPAWNEAEVGSAFVYFREDRNTDWIRADMNGRLTGYDVLAEVLSTIPQQDFIRGAFIALRHGESVEAGLERGQTMKLFSSRHDLHLDTAFL
ncbi:MAG: hypothetical protein NWT12_12675 [Paracoccaceae bacterium]|jgi:hypothetical protein|nr:hypothetical protein [Paracoccaceae bacterium]MDP5367131.1 hypothetical protein [Paracoccaceae bacterium]